MSWLIFNYTNRAGKLFPKSILETKADTIINSKFYSANAYELCRSRYYADIESKVLDGYIEKLHLKIKDNAPTKFSDSEKEIVIKEWYEKGLDEFRNKVIFRPIIVKDN